MRFIFKTKYDQDIRLIQHSGQFWSYAVLLAVLPWRWSAVVALLGLALQLSLLNQAPQSAYFAQTLQLWEQGRFVQFYGLGQWLGWLWPYALLVYVAARLTRRSEPL